ncbi:MAG: hypothetical protein HXY20_09530 [Acidobacteria bacterium]|nr:hypothetical protein [Acidobacteriota bacterium]
MAEDLKRQASEMYRQRDELGNIRTSEGLSLKKIAYVSLALVVLVLLVVEMFGGFKRRSDPVVAATTPPPLVKEAPPAELMSGEPIARPEAANRAPDQNLQTPAPSLPKEAVEPAVNTPSAVSDAPPSPPTAAVQREGQRSRPVLKREAPLQTASRPAGRNKPATPEPAEAKPAAAPPAPAISDIERARRELARAIVLEKNVPLSDLIASPDSRGWEAEPLGAEEYAVTFTVLDKASGAPLQYVWKVNLSTRTATPLSYYARRLS